MDRRFAVITAGIILFAGCTTNNDEQLKHRLAESEQKRTDLQQFVTERDSFMADVVTAVNAVYADLERARTREGKLVGRAGTTGKVETTGSLDTRKTLLADIDDIGSTLKENRKRIADLEARARASRLKIASLDTLIANLKQTLLEREQSIAMLEVKVQGLEASVAEHARGIARRDSVIDMQTERMNTVYYVVGTRDELQKKGIIVDEGGFLWGLLGSTTVLASGVDSTEFMSIDRSRDQIIRVAGTIDEIIPRRKESFFAMAQQDDKHANLTITDPGRFWQDKYLVIVVD